MLRTHSGMCSVPQWQKSSRIGDGIPVVAWPWMRWDGAGLWAGHGGQNGAYKSAANWVSCLFWLMWPGPTWQKFSGVGKRAQPWDWGPVGRAWA